MAKYNVQVSFGSDANGRRIRKRFRADSKSELQRKIDQYKYELRQVSNPSDISFQKYSEHWFQTYKANRAKQTQEMYIYALRKCSALNPHKVNEITKSMCQATVNESWEHPSAAEDLANTLKQIFRSAVADGIISNSPAEHLELPKKPESKFYLLTDEDLKAVADADLNESDRLFVTLLQIFGLRPAEALALYPEDFDLDKKILYIAKACELSNDNVGSLKNTKTGVTREIPIPDALIPFLRFHFQGKSGSLLFQRKSGGPYTKSAYRRLSERILKAIGIPQCTLYSFRHRRATDLYYLCQRGIISHKYAAQTLGHSEIIFLRTYSHVDMKMENPDAIYPDISVPLLCQ